LRVGLIQALAGMKALPSSVVRALGGLALLAGASGLALVAAIAAVGGSELLTTSGSVALVFLFSLVLLLACSGYALAVGGTNALQKSLVPRWALVASGAAMLISVLAFLTFGAAGSKLGMGLLGGLGAGWLWAGLRRAV
jgi:hypothetical protein